MQMLQSIVPCNPLQVIMHVSAVMYHDVSCRSSALYVDMRTAHVVYLFHAS